MLLPGHCYCYYQVIVIVITRLLLLPGWCCFDEDQLSGEFREVLDQQNNTDAYSSSSIAAFNLYLTLFGNKMNKIENARNDFGFNIEIERSISSYVIEYYLPCASIVAVSSVSFIIPLTAIPGRVSLVVTLFLTLTNLIIQHEVSFCTIQN